MPCLIQINRFDSLVVISKTGSCSAAPMVGSLDAAAPMAGSALSFD